MTPELLIAGHIVKDVTADGWRPGGGALYAAVQASRLGLGVAVVTACSAEVDPENLLPDVSWHVQRSPETTTFKNRYEDGKRSQRLLARGQAIDFAEVPPVWLKAPLILLTPLFHEIEPSDVGRFKPGNSLLGLSAQGWLRELEDDHVHAAAFEASPPWLAGDVVFLSDEDVQDAERVAVWQQRVPIIALTRGRTGCTIWDVAGRHEISAAAVCENDPTGAGDVFAAAFLVRYHETRDVLLAAVFASAAGALSVRSAGLESVARREEIEALLAQGQVKVA
jgi:sugar/nucleoside kinase (ribokinase family)